MDRVGDLPDILQGGGQVALQAGGTGHPGQALAEAAQGSWWPDYTTWLADRSGGMKQAPRTLGSAKFRVAIILTVGSFWL